MSAANLDRAFAISLYNSRRQHHEKKSPSQTEAKTSVFTRDWFDTFILTVQAVIDRISPERVEEEEESYVTFSGALVSASRNNHY